MNVRIESSQPESGTDRPRVSNETVAACRHGDHSAFRRLYELCSHSVYSLMVRMVGLQDADDLTQQVFLRVFRAIDQFSGQSRIETWIHRVAVNEALQFLRRRHGREELALQHDPADGTRGHARRVEHRELLDQALARIDPELRVLFLLREVEGLSYAELAEVIAIPEGTIGSRLNRARRELKQHLVDLGWKS